MNKIGASEINIVFQSANLDNNYQILLVIKGNKEETRKIVVSILVKSPSISRVCRPGVELLETSKWIE
jgi:hypothetical protein